MLIDIQKFNNVNKVELGTLQKNDGFIYELDNINKVGIVFTIISDLDFIFAITFDKDGNMYSEILSKKIEVIPSNVKIIFNN